MNQVIHGAVVLAVCCLCGCSTTGSPVSTTNVSREPTQSTSVPVSVMTPEQSLQRVVSLIAGEWDNHQQRWLASQSGADVQAIPRLHYSIVPLEAPKVGRHLFLVQQSGGVSGNGPLRLRVWRFALDRDTGAVRQDVYAFRQPERYIALLRAGQQPELRHQDLIPSPGCSLRWAADGQAWSGSVDGQDCLVDDRPSVPPVYVRDELWLSGDQLTVRSASAPLGQVAPSPVVLKLQRAVEYSGWLAINPAGPTARSGDAQRPWHTRKDLRLHDGGQRLEVLWDDGSPSGWSLELARLHYANAAEPILRLDLIDDQSGQVVTYVWAGQDSRQIGMNLGWFQVGLTRLDSAAR